MNEVLFKITQWSAMQKWTNAITKDLTNFLNRLTEMNVIHSELKKSIEIKDIKYQKEMNEHIAKIKDLEKSKKQLTLKIRKGKYFLI